MRMETELKLDFKDVLIRPKRSTLSSRSQVSLQRHYKFRHSDYKWSGVPVIAANMDHTGTLAMAGRLAEDEMLTAINKFVSDKEWLDFAARCPEKLPYTFISSGTRDEDFQYLQRILSQIDIPFICLDVANGYSQHFIDYVKRTREAFPNKVIIAGNVVTGEMTEELVLSGADIVKVGIGPGSVCTTRKKTGVGYPQL